MSRLSPQPSALSPQPATNTRRVAWLPLILVAGGASLMLGTVLAPKVVSAMRGEPLPPFTAGSGTVELGTGPVNAKLTATIPLTNNTTEPITLGHALTSCTCTSTETRDQVVPPGGTIEVQVSLSIRKPGPNRETVTFVDKRNVLLAEVSLVANGDSSPPSALKTRD
ncbi:MAG: DUF1573 domain-containing protein [Gemmataceae bacterium]